MKTGIIVQARMTSTRLPGKVLKSSLEIFKFFVKKNISLESEKLLS